MTNEEMAAALTKQGWRVRPPLTKENCDHPRARGNGMLSSDGSSKTSWYCPDCHHSYEFESPPSQHMPKVQSWYTP